MTLNAVIRCSTCNKVSKKLGSQDGVCSQCLEIIELKDIIGNTISYINLFAEELGVFFYQIKNRLEGKQC